MRKKDWIFISAVISIWLSAFMLSGCRNFEKVSEQDIVNAEVFSATCVANPGWSERIDTEQSVLLPAVPPLTVDIAYDECAASQGLNTRLTAVELRLKEINKFLLEYNNWRKEYIAWQLKNKSAPVCTPEGCFP